MYHSIFKPKDIDFHCYDLELYFKISKVSKFQFSIV
jgi:hypothetical protein